VLAGPLSVMMAGQPVPLKWREQGLLSWSGLRWRRWPIVLALIPVEARGVPGDERMVDAGG